MTWYLVIRRRTGAPADARAALERHLDWMRSQHEQGTVLISGPSSDPMTGLYVVRAASRNGAASVAADDPLAQDGEATIEIIEWRVHQMLGIGPFDLQTLEAMEPRR